MSEADLYKPKLVVDNSANFGPVGMGQAGPLQGGGGGGTSDDMSWQASIEGRVEGLRAKVDAHLLWVLGVFGAGFLLLAGLIVNRTDAITKELGAKIEGVGQQVGTVKTDVEVLKATRPEPVNPAPRGK